MQFLTQPILVISYTDNILKSISASVNAFDRRTIECTSFYQAENECLTSPCSGIIVDLTSIIKARDIEKTVAYSLCNIFPTLRVRAMGSTIVPMSMPGQASQDKSLNDFLHKTCNSFSPRRLRSWKRHDIFTPLEKLNNSCSKRAYSSNISWGGGFCIDLNPENLLPGDEFRLRFEELDIITIISVCWIQPWGNRRMPGYGFKFVSIDDDLRSRLSRILPRNSENDRDRLSA